MLLVAQRSTRWPGVLVHFVKAWNLSLNPEDLSEIAYAVLLHHDSDASWEEIESSVRTQIEEHRQNAVALTQAMQDAPDERG